MKYLYAYNITIRGIDSITNYTEPNHTFLKKTAKKLNNYSEKNFK